MSNLELDPDIVLPNATNSDIKVNKTFQVPIDHYDPKGLSPQTPSISDGPLGDQIPGELPITNIDFKIIDDQKTKIVSFQEIESILMTNRTVSQETAKLIDSKIPGFLAKESTIMKFTVSPSKAGYDTALRYVQETISQEFETIYPELLSFVKAYFETGLKQLTEFLQEKKNQFIDTVETIKEDIEEQERVTSSKNLIVAMGENAFHNLLTDTFDELKGQSLSEETVLSNVNYTHAHESLCILMNCVEKESIAKLIHILRMSSFDAKQFYSLPSSLVCETGSLTGADLISLVVNTDLDTCLDQLFEQFNQYLEEKKEIVNQLRDADKMPASDLFTWFLTYERDVREIVENIHALNALTIMVPTFLLSLKVYMQHIAAI